MDVFDLDQSLIADYERFARSFTQIRAADIRQQIDAVYASRRFWPEPLISINPHFERAASIDELVAEGSISPETGRVFRVDGQGITLYRHQAQAVAKAAASAEPAGGKALKPWIEVALPHQDVIENRTRQAE